VEAAPARNRWTRLNEINHLPQQDTAGFAEQSFAAKGARMRRWTPAGAVDNNPPCNQTGSTLADSSDGAMLEFELKGALKSIVGCDHGDALEWQSWHSVRCPRHGFSIWVGLTMFARIG
jgi:hypothetical protein